MSAALAELVIEVARALIRDPRVHPRKGDVIDDDPPLVPLTVVRVVPEGDYPAWVVAERREVWQARVRISGEWRGTLAQWRGEMAAAELQVREGT